MDELSEAVKRHVVTVDSRSQQKIIQGSKLQVSWPDEGKVLPSSSVVRYLQVFAMWCYWATYF